MVEKAERIAKVLARAGLCSRREAERWIESGRVQVDDETLQTPAVTVTKENVILVDGNPLPERSESRLWRYHKPPGLVTSHKDPQGRQTVFEQLPKELGRVISVGRLDLNSEGLLLLTNDGELARKLEMPSTGWVRRYRVRVHGKVDDRKLQSLKDGITIMGVRYGAIDARQDENPKSSGGANVWLNVSLAEGKNREIRKVMEHLGLSVNRLIRVSYGPFHLGKIARGGVEEVSGKVLRDQVRDEAKTGENRGQGWAKSRKKPPRKRPSGRAGRKPS